MKSDNGRDHRAGTMILQAEKPARKPGFACITLLSIQLRQVDPINSVWEFAIQESDYVTVTDQ